LKQEYRGNDPLLPYTLSHREAVNPAMVAKTPMQKHDPKIIGFTRPARFRTQIPEKAEAKTIAFCPMLMAN
jgi:hypothetical protein